VRQYLSSRGFRHTLQNLDMDHFGARKFSESELVFLLSLHEVAAQNQARKEPLGSLLEAVVNDLSLRVHKHPVGANPYDKARPHRAKRPSSQHPKAPKQKAQT
jgi:hypothetical protein